MPCCRMEPDRAITAQKSGPVSLEPEVSVGPLVFHSVVGLYSGRTCKAQGWHLQPRT